MASSDAARIDWELMEAASRHGVTAGWATLFIAAFVYLVLRTQMPDDSLLWWYVAITVIALSSVGASLAWQLVSGRDRPYAAQATVRRRVLVFRRLYVVLGGLKGLAWGALATFAGQAEDLSVAIAFVLAAALVLSVSAHAGNRLAQLLFVVSIVVMQEAVLLQHALSADALSQMLPFDWLVLAVCVLVAQRRGARALTDRMHRRIREESQAREQATLLENAPLGILVVRGSEIVVCNDTLVKLFGYPGKEALVGQDLRMVMPDDAAWQVALEQTEQARLRGSASRIVRRRTADGAIVEFMLKVAVVPATDGVEKFIGIYEDVQERIAIEENFRDLVRMQRMVFDAAGEGIAIVKDGIIEQANPALSDLVGRSQRELTDVPLRELFEDPESWSEIEQRFERVGSRLKLERRIVRADGRVSWANVTGCLVDEPRAGEAGSGHAGQGARAIWVLADLSAQKQKEAENWHYANHDVMTGLPNRRFLQDRLGQALASARRDGRRVGVMVLDLDGFKSINDTHGHRVGDTVLEEVARRLATVVRELDSVGRWGGDEFVLVLKEIESQEVVEEMVRRVIGRLSDPIVHANLRLTIGTSIGIALCPDHAEDVEALLLAADLAMYDSKGCGGNTWRFANPPGSAVRGKYRPGPASIPVSVVNG